MDENKYATTKNTEIKINYPNKTQEFQADETNIPNDGIAIFFAEKTEPFAIRTDQEFILGRKMEELSEPLLDLSDIDGYEMGVSRRHAMIRQAESGYEIIDLSSTNGTWLNDERLVSKKPYPLASGSRLRLSRIRLFVSYRIKDEK